MKLKIFDPKYRNQIVDNGWGEDERMGDIIDQRLIFGSLAAAFSLFLLYQCNFKEKQHKSPTANPQHITAEQREQLATSYPEFSLRVDSNKSDAMQNSTNMQVTITIN